MLTIITTLELQIRTYLTEKGKYSQSILFCFNNMTHAFKKWQRKGKVNCQVMAYKLQKQNIVVILQPYKKPKTSK